MIDLGTVYSNTVIASIFPNVLAKNATGAGLTDGTEFIAAGLNNGPEFGFMQAAMAYAAGGTNAPTGTVGAPNGVSDAAGVSQIIEAIQRGHAIGPGKGVLWWLNDDPSVTLDRVLLLQGQGVLVATYLDLTAEVYVGDGNNGAAQAVGAAFFKSSTADGLNPIDGGDFLILPEGRGYALRGLDLAASVDPDGATRLLGDNQIDAFQGHGHELKTNAAGGDNVKVFAGVIAGTGPQGALQGTSGTSGLVEALLPLTIGAFGTERTSEESRMSNLSVQFGITY